MNDKNKPVYLYGISTTPRRHGEPLTAASIYADMLHTSYTHDIAHAIAHAVNISKAYHSAYVARLTIDHAVILATYTNGIQDK